ncbi:SDR family NAD(P)-dependent oxidoreductase [Actinokineospora sp. PR83]|uniref:SDR family NAD(P)-dependent oxidoreductase n=1 Tax=Actinokineospora sp. PR83 TaxID=2884908 RepID=UPI0027DEC888|nr:SDR family NAD(P)-dependent oxidoreductase [Actinokineospora sp. PR83]MCG8918369.1 SDR family NAD(P)-dependent oxidoreductase [Actinokineospora sp. PR83]
MSAALITGGGTGVGFALAERLVADGVTVLVCGRDADRLALAERMLPGLRTTVADLADPVSVDRLAATALALGGLDLLVNNAAVQLDRSWASADRDALAADIAAELGADLAGPLRLTARLLPALAAAPSATIVNVTSALGVVPKRSAPVYCAAKAGLIAFSAGLRHQLAVDAPHVRVVDAMLPLVDTAMTEGRGSRKISAGAAADGILGGVRRGRSVVRVGGVGVLLAVHRLAPGLAARLVAD